MDTRLRLEIENQRCTAGYIWHQCKIGGRQTWMLSQDRSEVEIAGYVPEENVSEIESDSAVFLRLAAIEQSRPAIVRFATIYGNLSRSIQNRDVGETSSGEVYGACWGRWIYHIATLKHWTTVWELYRAGDRDAFESYCRSRPRTGFYKGSRRISPDIPMGRVAKLSQREVDFMLGPYKGLYLESARGTLLTSVREHVLPLFPKTSSSDSPIFSLQAFGLADTAWLQFARAIDQNIAFRRCKECNSPFEETPGVLKANREFCEGNRCRLKYHRKRKKRSRQMRTEGATLRTIAKELGSDLETVKGWVADVKKTSRAK